MNNGNGFYKTGLLKGFIACALVALITCGITVHKYVYAEGQTKYSKDFF